MTAKLVPTVVKAQTPFPCGLRRTRKKETINRRPLPSRVTPTTPPPLHHSQSWSEEASPAIAGGTAHAVGRPCLSFSPQTNCTLRGSGGRQGAALSVGWTATELLTIVAPGWRLPSRILPIQVSPNIQSVRPSPRSTDPAQSAPVQPSVRSKTAFHSASGVTPASCRGPSAKSHELPLANRIVNAKAIALSRLFFTPNSLRVGEEGDQVGQVLLSELFIEPGRHHRYGAGAHLFDLIAWNADRFRSAGHQHHFVRSAGPFQAVKDFAGFGHDLDWLITADETRAGKQDGFKQITLGAN